MNQATNSQRAGNKPLNHAAPLPINVQTLVEAAGGIKPLAKVIGQADYDGYHRVEAWVEAGEVPEKVMRTHGAMLRKLITRHERKQSQQAATAAEATTE